MVYALFGLKYFPNFPEFVDTEQKETTFKCKNDEKHIVSDTNTSIGFQAYYRIGNGIVWNQTKLLYGNFWLAFWEIRILPVSFEVLTLQSIYKTHQFLACFTTNLPEASSNQNGIIKRIED